MATSKLFEAARLGRVDVLNRLLSDNPSILADSKLISLSESLLHVAAKSGQLDFVHELMTIDPDAAQELDKDGFRPLDTAVIIGNLGIVREILRFNRDLCLLKGKDRRTALHYAAIKGRVDVIDELLNTCPDSVEDVTVYGETALHLAVKYFQFDAFSSLVAHLTTLGKEPIINARDAGGDTVLHFAVLTKQYACIDLLIHENSSLRGTIDVNIKNAQDLTALDVLDIQSPQDTIICQKLESVGATRAQNTTIVPTNSAALVQTLPPNQALQPEDPKNWFKYFKFQIQRDSPSDTRNALLVVAALIATVCYQAGINPPSGILNTKTQQASPPKPPPGSPPPYINPGLFAAMASTSAIFGSHSTSSLFLFANSLGLTASTCIIIYLTSDFPFQRELHMSLYSMMFTYGFAISSIVKEIDRKEKTLAYILLTIAFILPFALRWLPHWAKRAWKYWRSRNARSTLPRSHWFMCCFEP